MIESLKEYKDHDQKEDNDNSGDGHDYFSVRECCMIIKH